MPAQLLLGLGMGTAFAAGMNLATYGVDPQDAGVASAMLNTSQQVGGSIGTALLNTIAASAATGWAAAHAAHAAQVQGASVQLQSATHGYTTAFRWAAAILTLSAAVIAVCVRDGEQGHSEDDANEVTDTPSRDADDRKHTPSVMAH